MNPAGKGVSTFVAAVLLLAITISIGVLASGSFSQVTKDIIGETSNKSEKTSAAADYGIDLSNPVHNTADKTLEVTVANEGDKISGNITLTAMCKNQTAYQKQVSGLERAEAKRYSMSVPACTLESVTAALKNYPVERELEQSDIKKAEFKTWFQDTNSDFESVKSSSNDIQFFSSSIQLSQTQKSKEETASGGFSGTKINLTNSGSYLKLETP